jgi:phosphatidylinositol kinase/protein kinase (PI-3  family)
LRQDERVQQVFRAMNQVLVGDPRCAQGRLSIVTYSVVPISKSDGLIEWIQRTKPMAAVLDECNGFPEIRKAAETKYSQFYKDLSAYEKALRSKDGLNDRLELFTEICSQVPSQVLRSGILKLASNAQVIFVLVVLFFVC